MEKDDEVKGSGNSYDFGARLYDSRIARFMSMDPLFENFPFISPYCFAANSPIKYLDFNGEGPNDEEVGSNFLIIIDKQEVLDNVKNHPKTVMPENWNVVFATDVVSAAKQMKSIVGEGKVNNLIIRSHAGGGGISAGKVDPTASTMDQKAQRNIENGEVQMYGRKDKNSMAKSMWDGTSEIEKESVYALEELVNMVEEGGNLIFTGCYSEGMGNSCRSSFDLNNIDVFDNVYKGAVLYKDDQGKQYLRIDEENGKNLGSKEMSQFLLYNKDNEEGRSVGNLYIYDNKEVPFEK